MVFFSPNDVVFTFTHCFAPPHLTEKKILHSYTCKKLAEVSSGEIYIQMNVYVVVTQYLRPANKNYASYFV